LIHQPQQGINLRAGDDYILEGGFGRKFDTEIGTVTAGVASYAYWQVTAFGGAVPPSAQSAWSNVYGLGPEITATTKYGLYYLRFFSEFGAANSRQGHSFVAGVALAF
jgi:hypothetical protein